MCRAILIVAAVITGIVACDSSSERVIAVDEFPLEPNLGAAAEQATAIANPVLHLSRAQRQSAGIVTEPLTARALDITLRAPGEVKLNAYSTYQVTPRIRAQVVERHAQLGDRVLAGEALVTLSSVEMADAQGELVVSEREWLRVRDLGREVVSERRYIETEVAAQQARARALAYGMLPTQIDALVRAGDASSADGTFTLLSPAPGTVVRDDFLVGESIDAGRLMFEIADESTLWVEARLPARDASIVAVGNSARVNVGERWIEGRVIQAFHALDESTRTLPVRVEIPNPDDDLHPGLFVDVLILDDASEPVLAVPETAVLGGTDEDLRLFVASAEDSFEAVEITVARTAAGFAAISGVEAGTLVVTEGAFFLQSELAKSGFDIHQH